jgi:monoterpene epsilon-lactone hydrolase
MGSRRIAVTGDSAGGNLALVLASRVVAEGPAAKMGLVAVAAFRRLPTLLSRALHMRRVRTLKRILPDRGQPNWCVHIWRAPTRKIRQLPRPTGDLPACRRCAFMSEMMKCCWMVHADTSSVPHIGVDARLDVWMGMIHGFVGSVGKLKASAHSLDAVGAFLNEKLQSG